ncbi:CU044_5270 family protein [Streptomyces sp. LRE541]|uniref:CU044_5270 family protein n=1 Tax=Streptomyces sp. LRE541 TaxID=2931983 RepID=UPI00200DB233|nr:CU044_5270 family protein [Streptomyces sp. LRE541]UPZ29894.1 CU044_5270 family protein [Streptomyces sp. LRE541]
MNANTPRHGSAESESGSQFEWEQDAQLLSRTARDLPSGRHQFHKERLMAQIHEQVQRDERTAAPAAPAKTRRSRRPRPAITLPAMAFGLSAVIVAGIVTFGDGDGVRESGVATGPALTTDLGTATTKGVPQLLDQISLAAAEGDHPTVQDGQYVYIESVLADTFVKTVDDKSTLASHELHKRQIWESADGVEGWLIDAAVNESSEGETLTLPDEQGNTPKAHLGSPSYDYLTKLTTDPDALLAKIYKETEGQGNTPDQQAFSTIGDLLAESYPPAELYPALFEAAARIPGVVVVDDAVDAVGRHGVAVARLDETSGQREEWIFDKKSHVYLGARNVQVKPLKEEGILIKPGTVNFTMAIKNRAVVDGMKETPSAPAQAG